MLLLLWNRNAAHAVDTAKKMCENVILKDMKNHCKVKTPRNY